MDVVNDVVTFEVTTSFVVVVEIMVSGGVGLEVDTSLDDVGPSLEVVGVKDVGGTYGGEDDESVGEL